MPTAILIDGAYFIKRFRSIEPHNIYNAKRAAEFAFRSAVAHLSEPYGTRGTNGEKRQGSRRHELYRIFFYDCPPLEKKLHNPITKKSVDFGRSQEAAFRFELHELLRQRRKVALRLGHLAGDTPWTIKPHLIEELLKGKKKFEELVEGDVVPNVRQKGVDMRIGIDISSLSIKKQVDQIVLIAGDADFVPAAKLARRESVDFVLDPMWQDIPSGLNEHIDGLRSTCPRPKKKSGEADISAVASPVRPSEP